MKPSRIFEVLDLAYEARKKGMIFNPLLTGAAGLGKSEICQQWANGKRKQNKSFGFVDVRCAYKEGPDLQGKTLIEKDANGVERTVYALPDFWPTEGEGLLLFEEPNRATTMVTNCLMQILTDRKIENYTLPEGWIIAAAINPDDPSYDVGSMDTALKNRFVEFEIEYDHNTFCEFIEKNDWCQNIQMFVKSGAWQYKDAANLGDKAKYISPRSWSQLNAAHAAGAQNDKQMHRIVCTSVLGRDYGGEFWKFVHDDAPVTARDLINDEKKALKKLKEQCKPNDYKGDMVSVTVESIIKDYGGDKLKNDKGDDLISEDVMVKVAEILPSDQALVLIKECGLKSHRGNINTFFNDFMKRHPQLLKIVKGNIKLNATAPATK
jgi:alkaline phosphatase D